MKATLPLSKFIPFAASKPEVVRGVDAYLAYLHDSVTREWEDKLREFREKNS